jgi:hypothetical protein
MADLLAGRKLYLFFILNSILQVRFIKIGTKYITFGLMIERVLLLITSMQGFLFTTKIYWMLLALDHLRV